MTQNLLIGLIGILTIGVSSQWLAWRLRVPSIVLLIVSGFLVGPVFGLLKPDALLGELFFPLVSISVAIILFEGGLSLKFSELTHIAKVVRNLITIGLLTTWILCAAAAWVLLKFSFSMSVLFGAILVVTGPTVIGPLLKHLRLSGKTASVLRWEAMLNDPIGAILSILVFEAILSGGFKQATGHTVLGLLRTVFFGLAMGVISARVLSVSLKRYWVPDFLQSVFALMMVLMTFGFSHFLQAESGLLAVTIMGILLANDRDVEIEHIIEFKENLRVLLISSIFIILAARLEMQYFAHIGWPVIFFLLFIILLVRPLAVMISTSQSDLSFREKLFISLMAPRGIVAAAVGSVFALEFEHLGLPGGDKLVAMIFFVIVGTIVIYGVLSPFVARAARVSQPNPQGLVILGAHVWARKIAQAVGQEGFRVLLIDSNAFNVSRARAAGLAAVHGNIFSDEFAGQLDLSGIGKFIGMTSNDEVNSLACLHFNEIFGRADVYQLQGSESTAVVESRTKKLRGRFLFEKGMSHAALNDLFRQKATIHRVHFTKTETYEKFKNENAKRFVPLFLITESKQLKMMTAENPPAVQENQSLLVLSFQPAQAPQPG
ncbi:cation:proton antiporter [Omnitrophica bacterium]|nr:cation:proton antiporter [Candidatus Omnitrophota bacterium]